MKSSRGVSDDWILEICVDAFVRSFDCFHLVLCGGFELWLGAHGNVRADGVFEIGVQPLIRIQLRRKGRQILISS